MKAQILWSLFLSAVVTQSLSADLTEGGAQLSHQGSRDYASHLRQCSRGGAEQVSFFTAFRGLWPVPSNFVLVDATNQQLEYNDRAFPWDDVRSESAIFYGRRASIEQRWPGVFSRAVAPVSRTCGLEIRKFNDLVEFPGDVVIVLSGSYEHLLLVGPIAESVNEAMECYALTARASGAVCQ